MTPEDIDYTLAQLETAQTYFAQHDAVLAGIVVCPDKEDVYPELYPKAICLSDERTQMERLASEAQLRTNLNFLHLKNALLAAKTDDQLLYYRNFDPTHWNIYGAFVGYREIISLLQDCDASIEALDLDEIEVTAHITKNPFFLNNCSALISDNLSFQDFYYTYMRIGGFESREIDAVLAEDVPGYIYMFHYINDAKSDASKLMILGDSYVYSFLLPLLAESFSEVFL